ncbi:TY-Chap domain-containing protein [Oryzobacter telluris]|uniref:TY-Chap domain-containing protein n=1 Tax=Oryzobacter telluris TaxID=3149179 RepID=UPI00370D4464
MSADPAPDHASADWASWSRDLEQALLGLGDGESLTVTAPGSASRPSLLRKARLRGFVPAKHEQVAPWVRLTRREEHLRGFCIGSQASGGRFPLSDAERAALTDLGWHEPHQFEGEHLVRWWPDDVPNGPFLPDDDLRRAVAMVVATFRGVLAPPTEDHPAPALPTVTSD